jgi:hypothetical protein
MPGHPIYPHGALLDTMRCLSMLLQGRPPHRAYSDRRSFFQSWAHTEAQCR